MLRVVLYLLLVLYVVGPITTIFGLGRYEDTSFLASLVVIVLSIFKYNHLSFEKELYEMLASILLLATFVVIVFFIRGDGWGAPVQLVFRSVRIVITIVAGFLLAKLLLKTDYSYHPNKYASVLFVVIVLHSILMIAMMLDASFRESVYQFTNAGGDDIASINKQGRMAGLFGAGGAYLSVFQSFGVVIGLFLSEKTAGLKRVLVQVLIFVVIASTIISGRTGFYVSLFFVIYFIFRNLRNNKIWVFKFVALFFVLFVFTAGYLVTLFGVDSSFQWVVTRTFKTILVFVETGELRDVTVSHLLTNYTLTDEFLTYLVGLGSDQGYYGRYFDSDLGYLKYIAAFGVLGSVIAVYPYLYLMYKSMLMKNQLLVSLLIVSLVAHGKEVFLFGRGAFPLIVFLFYVQFLVYRYEKNKSCILYPR